MWTAEYNLSEIIALLDEVVVFVDSSQFLHPNTLEDTRMFTVDDLTYSWSVRDISHYIESIDINNEDTPYLNLENDIMSPVQTCYYGIHSYGLTEIDEAVDSRKRRVVDFVDASERVSTLARQAFEADPTCDDPAVLITHVRTTIGRQFAALMQCRALTTSRRYVPLEILFDAYRAGLYPYGWDWDTQSILCVRPNSE